MALEHTSSYVDISDFSRQLRKLQIPGGGENATDTDLWGIGWARLWIDDPDKPGEYYDQVRSPRTLNATTSPPRVEQVNTWQEWAAAAKRERILASGKDQIPDWTPKELIKDPFREIDLTEGAARWKTMETALAATDDADLDTFDTNLDNHIPDPATLERHIITPDRVGDGFAVGSIQMSILATPPGPLWRLADGSDCTGTAYATATGDNKLPDLRGAYLRMAGQNASNSAWDGGALGNWQEDRTARPDTAFTTNNAGAHTHSLGWYDQEAAGMVQQYGAWNATNPSPQVRHMNKLEDPSDGSNSAERTSNEREMAVSTDGQHVHAINGGGDAETRPKTYCVNYFIKVDSVITPALTSDKQPSPSTQQPAPGTSPLNRWPVGSLKHLLDSMKIAYPADATISDLVALVPDTHQHHLVKEIPTPTWTNTQIVQWLEKEGADVPDALKDDKDALSEMVHDIIELKAGLPLDPGFLYQ